MNNDSDSFIEQLKEIGQEIMDERADPTNIADPLERLLAEIIRVERRHLHQEEDTSTRARRQEIKDLLDRHLADHED